MKVSVIIPYKEDRGYLDDAIRSVEIQTYHDVELILSKGEGNAAENFNAGVKKSTGQLIKKLDSDDWLTPDSIERSVAGMKDYDFTHGNAYIVNRGVQPYISRVRHPNVQSLLIDSSLHGTTVLYRRDLFDRVGLFDESLDMAQEYEFHLRALQKGAKLGYVNSYLGFYRVHDKMKSLSDDNKRERILKEIKGRFVSYQIKEKTKKKVIWVDPRSIREQVAFFIEPHLLPHTHKADGHWPTVPVSRRPAMQAVYERYVEGKDWKDIHYYWYRVNNQYKGKNCAEYFQALDDLYESMRTKGYIHRHAGWRFSEYSKQEIGVVKDGDRIIWAHDGQHRLAIAQILGIEKIPVRVILER